MIRDEDLEFYDEDKVCFNCKHWNTASSYLMPFDGGVQEMTNCKKAAIDPDAGVSVVLTGGNGNCRNHSDMWQPTKDFMDEVRERMTQPAKIYGVTPGVDCPATLNRQRAA